MSAAKAEPKNIDEYIAGFPPDVQAKLEKVRATIGKAAPEAEEKISYGLPAFAQKRILVYFGGHKGHIGLYPTSSGIAKFKKELSAYESSKGAVKFPLDKPIPFALITKIVKFRVKENLEKEKEGEKKKEKKK